MTFDNENKEKQGNQWVSRSKITNLNEWLVKQRKTLTNIFPEKAVVENNIKILQVLKKTTTIVHYLF